MVAQQKKKGKKKTGSMENLYTIKLPIQIIQFCL